ncbi:MAG: M55 family metallopeptidase [Desulfitobacteriaceae bacterium]
MKVFISVDIEGCAGVVAGRQLADSEYNRFRKIMTDETNAAIEGAFNAGASEVLVNDAHGHMMNILIEELDDRARLISGNNKPLSQMQGIDETFDAALFVGYHAREGHGAGVLSHTVMGRCVSKVSVNGVLVGETALNAAIAGYYGVPLVFVAGDDVVEQEAKEIVPEIETAVVKRAIERFVAESLTPRRAQKLIREGVERAIRKSPNIKPYTVGAVTFEVEFKLVNQASLCTLFPTVEQIGPKTIRIQDNDYVRGYKQLWGCLIMALATTNGVLG